MILMCQGVPLFHIQPWLQLIRNGTYRNITEYVYTCFSSRVIQPSGISSGIPGRISPPKETVKSPTFPSFSAKYFVKTSVSDSRRLQSNAMPYKYTYKYNGPVLQAKWYSIFFRSGLTYQKCELCPFSLMTVSGMPLSSKWLFTFLTVVKCIS